MARVRAQGRQVMDREPARIRLEDTAEGTTAKKVEDVTSHLCISQPCILLAFWNPAVPPNHFGVGDRGRAKDGEASSNAERCPCLEHSTAWAGPTELLRACGVCLPLCTSGNIDLIHRSNFSGKPSSCCLSSTPCSFNLLLGVLDVTTESLKGFFGDGCLAQSSMADLLLAEIGDPPRLSFS